MNFILALESQCGSEHSTFADDDDDDRRRLLCCTKTSENSILETKACLSAALIRGLQKKHRCDIE